MWNLWRNKLRSIFSKQLGFVNGPDLVAQSTGKPLKSANKNLPTKIRSYTNHAWKWVLWYKLLWFYWTVLSFNIFHHDAWWFFYLIIEWNTTPLVKGRSRHFSHVRLCCDCRAAWASATTTRSAAVMGRACDSWHSKPLGLVLWEIIG